MAWKKDKDSEKEVESLDKKEEKDSTNESAVKEEENQENTSPQNEKKVQEGADENSSTDLISEKNKKLEEENQKLQNELEAIKDRLLRTTAEYENFRKRTIKEKEGIYGDACEDVLKNMFPVLDNLERANSVEGSVDDIKKGIEMTIRQFQDGLQKLGVEEIDASSEFNPNFHNAVMHIEDENFGKNMIVEVFQKGYKRGDKILRFSMVKVAN